MKVVVIATNELKEELSVQGIHPDTDITWLNEPSAESGADCIIDLLFDNDPARTDQLNKTGASTIIVNDVAAAGNISEHFVRINAWPGFLKRHITEAACDNEKAKANAENIFKSFGKTVEWVADKPGFITARVISMIINEAYLALEEEVSSKEEIDTAMKLGTNYPYGPFEWAQKIGLKNVYSLLEKLSRSNARYQPSALLKKEALI